MSTTTDDRAGFYPSSHSAGGEFASSADRSCRSAIAVAAVDRAYPRPDCDRLGDTSCLRCEHAQGRRRSWIAGLPRHRAGDDGGLDPLAVDAVGGAGAAPELCDPCPRSRIDRRGGGRPAQRVRQVRPRGLRNPCARRADGAAGRSRAVPSRPQPDVSRGDGHDHGAGALPRSMGAARIRRDLPRRDGRVRALVRGAHATSSSGPSTRPTDARSRAGGPASGPGRLPRPSLLRRRDLSRLGVARARACARARPVRGRARARAAGLRSMARRARRTTPPCRPR